MLVVEGLKVYYFTEGGVVRAVDGVGFTVNEGEMLAIVGESGSGKSTLAYALLNMVPPPGKIVEGRVLIDKKNILALKGEELRRARGELIAMIFQDPFTTLDPVRRVGDYAVEILTEHGVGKEEAKRRVKEVFKQVGLPDKAFESYPHQLSGGQRQRVAIAIAIALKPKVIVADEPTTALDVIVQKQIMDLIDSLKEMGISIILITHDIALAAERADKIAVMYAGKIVEYGKKEEVIRDPLHPYTKALLASVPELDKGWPKAIPGFPPDLRNPPEGCRFRPRCPYAKEICLKEPPEVEVGGRRVSCWLYEMRR